MITDPGLHIAAPDTYTFHKGTNYNTLDYAILGGGAQHFLHKLEVVPATLDGHRPVLFHLHTQSGDAMIHTLTRLSKMPGSRPIGPAANPAPWDEWHTTFERLFPWLAKLKTTLPDTEVTNNIVQRSDEVWATWTKRAANELECLTGINPPQTPFKTRRATISKAAEIRPCPGDRHRPRYTERVRRFEWTYRRLSEIGSDVDNRHLASHGKMLSTNTVRGKAPGEWQEILLLLGRAFRRAKGCRGRFWRNLCTSPEPIGRPWKRT
jgi:hypothetical protein